jgi:hypothetical protein
MSFIYRQNRQPSSTSAGGLIYNSCNGFDII